MADTSTIASLATAGGTLILAVATFSSTRSANRAARISEQALKVGLRPVLFNARPQDPPQKVGFVDDHWVHLRDGLAAAQVIAEKVYLAIPLRNVASGLRAARLAHLDGPPNRRATLGALRLSPPSARPVRAGRGRELLAGSHTRPRAIRSTSR